jgi:hypothetical protein
VEPSQVRLQEIGFVGFTGSGFDAMILQFASTHLGYPVIEFDEIDLSQGRDFLSENKKYEIIIVNYIFKYREDELTRNELSQLDRQCRVSKDHSPQNWKCRLLATEAKTIILFSGPYDTEVDAYYIRHLTGYRLTKIENDASRTHIYKRMT